MLVLTPDINNTYSTGLTYLSNLVYNQFAMDLYGVQYKKGRTDRKLLMLLFALQSWVNKEGYSNLLTTSQLISVMGNILKCRVDQLACSSMSTCSDKASGQAASLTLEVLDTASSNLSYQNGVLSVDTKISQAAGNSLSLLSDGLFATAGSQVKLVTSSMFSDAVTYSDTSLYGKKLQVFYRGMGYLIYDESDPLNNSGINEWQPLPEGGFQILIPGFNVFSATNYFFIIIS